MASVVEVFFTVSVCLTIWVNGRTKSSSRSGCKEKRAILFINTRESDNVMKGGVNGYVSTVYQQ